MERLRTRLRIEVVLAVISAALCVLTLVFPEWIEELTGLEPDAGSGALEWIIAGVFLVAAVVSAVLARRDYRRLAADHS
jgi:ABC-type thiamin/hydroxymethylpyrimidine transport system permease subunit